MADFGSFLLGPSAQPDDTRDLQLLKELQEAQGDLASDEDDMIAALRHLLLNGGQIGPILTEDLFEQCREVAREKNLTLPNTKQGFGQRLKNLQSVIQLQLQASYSEVRVHANKKSITIIWIGDKAKRGTRQE